MGIVLNEVECQFKDESIWLTSKRVYELYSISRQGLYRLLKANKIASRSDRRAGARKGARYWLRKSIDLYFASMGDGVNTFGDEKYTYSYKEMFINPIIEFQIEPRFEKIVVPHQR